MAGLPSSSVNLHDGRSGLLQIAELGTVSRSMHFESTLTPYAASRLINRTRDLADDGANVD